MAILDAAAELLATDGPDGTTITTVADRAGLATSSVYDYFEDDRSLIGAVAERSLDQMHHDLIASIGSPTSLEEMAASASDSLRLFLGRYEQDVGLREAVAFVDADPTLMHININDSRRNAAIIGPLVAGLRPGVDLAPAVFLMVHLSGALASLVARVDTDEAAQLIEQFERLLTLTLSAEH